MGPMTGAQNGSLIEEQTRRSVVKREAEIFYLEFNSRNLWSSLNSQESSQMCSRTSLYLETQSFSARSTGGQVFAGSI